MTHKMSEQKGRAVGGLGRLYQPRPRDPNSKPQREVQRSFFGGAVAFPKSIPLSSSFKWAVAPMGPCFRLTNTP